MQNKMIRFILNLGNRAHIGSAEYEKVNMLSVSDRVRQLKLNHVFKIRRGQCPEYMKENFCRIGDTELRICTRATSNNLFLPRVNNQAVHTFFFSAIKEWNLLPAKIKELSSEETFRTMIKKHIVTELRNRELCPYIYYT